MTPTTRAIWAGPQFIWAPAALAQVGISKPEKRCVLNYGLALVAQLNTFSEAVHGISIGCECVSHGMSLKDTASKQYIGTFWFDTERDRQCCMRYADSLSQMMCQLYSMSPDAQLRRYN